MADPGGGAAGRRRVAIAAVVGAAWGLGGYLVLWGHSPLVVHRPFVVSAVGTALLLPVRLVLGAIRVVEERVVGRSFDLSASTEWIGILAGVVGAGLAIVVLAFGRFASRRVRAFRAPG